MLGRRAYAECETSWAAPDTKRHPSANFASAGEQTSSELATYQVLAKGKSMPKVRPSFMTELDQWTQANVLGPMYHTDPNQADWEDAASRIKKAIRSKVLESYRNGQAAGPRKSFKR